MWENYIELMGFSKDLWWWVEVYNEFKEYEKKNPTQNIEGHEIKNHIQPCPSEHHSSW